MLIITGTYPPERCGVGDYTKCLLSTAIGQQWQLLYHKDWSIKNLPLLCRMLNDKDEEKVVNLQYPTMGYSTRLTPHFLALYATIFRKKKLILTIHEYSQLGWKGKLALRVLFRAASSVVFTTDFERQKAINDCSCLKDKTAVIKINSNIPAVNQLKPAIEREWDLGFFGFIRPRKGLEDFIEVAAKISEANPDAKIYVMGQTQPEYEQYHTKMLATLKGRGIEYFGEKNSAEVAETLNDTKIAYLPYPDGLSERRGSFLAAAVNGCAIISNRGDFTTKQQAELITLADTSEVADKVLLALNDNNMLSHLQHSTAVYVKTNVPDSWETIAKEYKKIEDSL